MTRCSVRLSPWKNIVCLQESCLTTATTVQLMAQKTGGGEGVVVVSDSGQSSPSPNTHAHTHTNTRAPVQMPAHSLRSSHKSSAFRCCGQEKVRPLRWVREWVREACCRTPLTASHIVPSSPSLPDFHFFPFFSGTSYFFDNHADCCCDPCPGSPGR